MKKLLPLLLLPPLLSGCAAMFTGTQDEVLFQTSPEGGFVHLDDEVLACPVTRKIKKSTRRVLFSHPSFGEEELAIERSFKAGFLLMDLLFTPGFGLSGMLIDGSTSAWYDLPTQVTHQFVTTSLAQAQR